MAINMNKLSMGLMIAGFSGFILTLLIILPLYVKRKRKTSKNAQITPATIVTDMAYAFGNLAAIGLRNSRLIDSLRTSESHLKEAQSVAHIGHWELDPAVGTPVWSDEIFRIFDLEPGEGEPSFTNHETHLHPDDWPMLDEAVKKAAASGAPYDLVFRILRPGGEIRWMHSIGKTKRDKDGNIKKIFGTAQDITDRKLVENEIKEQRDFLEVLLNTIPNPIFYKDTKGRYIGYNKSYADFIGLSKKEILNKTVYDMGPKDIADKYYAKDR